MLEAELLRPARTTREPLEPEQQAGVVANPGQGAGLAAALL
jgi:hypothetical protein